MGRLHLYIFLFLLALAISAKAQYFNDDARLWLSVKIDKDISSKFNAEITLQNRIENNISEYSKLYGNIELTYKAKKYLRFIGGYSYGKRRRDDASFGDRNRVYAGIILRKKVKSFTFSYRNIFQATYKDIYTSEEGQQALYFNRNKITIKYELNKRIEFYTAQELNLSYDQRDYDNISRSRTYIGTNYTLSKKSNLEGYFMFQKHFRYKNQPRRDFVFGLTYSHSF